MDDYNSVVPDMKMLLTLTLCILVTKSEMVNLKISKQLNHSQWRLMKLKMQGKRNYHLLRKKGPNLEKEQSRSKFTTQVN